MVIELLEDLLELENVKPHDKNHMVSFLLTHCESEELRNKLEKKMQTGNLLFLKDKVVEIATRTIRKYKKEDFALSKLPYGIDEIESTLLPENWFNFLD